LWNDMLKSILSLSYFIKLDVYYFGYSVRVIWSGKIQSCSTICIYPARLPVRVDQFDYG